MGELYSLTSPSGKRYVGVTHRTAGWRFMRHSSNALSGGKSCRFLANALRKHGPENFIVETLVVGDFEYLLGLEQAAITTFSTMAPHGYNLREGGQGGRMSVETRERIPELAKERHRKDPGLARRHAAAIRGRKHTSETIEKMTRTRATSEWKVKSRAAHLGNVASDETKAKMSKAAKSRPPISKDTRRRMSEATKKRPPVSQKTRAKIREAAKSRPPISQETRRRMKEAAVKRYAVCKAGGS